MGRTGRKKRCPKSCHILKRKHTLNVELGARQITLKSDVGKVQARISRLNAIGLMTHRITIRIQKREHHNTISLRPDPSPYQKRRSKKRTLPRLQHNHLVSVRQFVRSDLLTKVFREYQQQLMGYSSVVRQQQMEKAKLITYNNTYLYQNQFPVWDPDSTTNFTSGFRPILLIDDYNLTYIDDY